MNVLLIQTAFIGDVVLTTPMIDAFKRLFPDSRLSVLVKPEAAAILSAHPAVDETLVIDKGREHRNLGILKIIREIRDRNFDLLLAPHRSHRTGIIAATSGIKKRFGYEGSGFARFAYTQRLKRDPESPEILRLLQFLQQSVAPVDWNGQTASTQLRLYETEASKNEAIALLERLEIERPIAIAASSVWPTKRWPAQSFAKLAVKLSKHSKSSILLLGSPADRAISQDVLLAIQRLQPEGSTKVHDVCGQTSLLGLFSLLKRCVLLVSNDSAPVHFGCAAGIPVTAIFGPTTPALGYAPIAPQTAVAELSGLSCRPCGTHGGRRCPLKHFRCMEDLSVEQVFETILKILPA